MAAKPTVVPELFTGDKSWDEWIDHFESVADICGWEDENKLKWMRARLSRGAGGVFRRLPDATKADYTQAKEALRKRFEPDTRRALYQTKLHSRVKLKSEGWAELGDDLKCLADKAYPGLGEEAKEQFALNQFLSQLNNPQVAFAVKQTKPTKMDDAVRATLEMESYIKLVPSGVSSVTDEQEEKETNTVAVTSTNELKLILEKMQQMEAQLKEIQRLISVSQLSLARIHFSLFSSSQPQISATLSKWSIHSSQLLSPVNNSGTTVGLAAILMILPTTPM